MHNKVVHLFDKDNDEGGKKMYIGGILKQRMQDLNIGLRALADEALVEESQIRDILSDKLSISEIDLMDLDLIAQVLYCNLEYFTNEEIRKSDMINAAMNRGQANSKSNRVKGQLQQFANDFVFLRNLL